MTTEPCLVCPVCDARLTAPCTCRGRGPWTFECPRCGPFRWDRDLYADFPGLRLDARRKAAISYAIRRAQRHNDTPYFGRDTIASIADDPLLPSPSEQVDNLVRWLGETHPAPGALVRLNIVEHRAVAGATTDGGFIFVVAHMIEEKLLSGSFESYFVEDVGHVIDGEASVTLTFKGWERFEALRLGAHSGFSAFMAMKFGDPELDAIVAGSFRPAVAATGFRLRRLDDEPKAGLIDDRLRVEIRASRFLVADLTHANAGAYWEAGFAEGLGKPVIYTCRRSVFEHPDTKPHFDTNHHLTVVWDPSQPGEAVRQLKATIRATLPEARQQD